VPNRVGGPQRIEGVQQFIDKPFDQNVMRV